MAIEGSMFGSYLIGRQKGQILDPTPFSGHLSRNSIMVWIAMLFQNIEIMQV
jgi:hypothetical protein